MTQKTTDQRGCFAARGTRAWRGVLAVCVVLLAGCSTAQPRESPASIVGVLRFRDARAAALFRDTHRAGNLYQDFRPVMSVDAVPMDRRYRELYLEMLKERYLMPEAQLAPLRAEQEEEFDNHFELVVLIYGGSNEPVPLERPHSVWRVLLRDDDGHLLSPSRIEKVHTDSPVYQYFNLYFYGLDRWTQLYRIRFPKLAKTMLGQAPGREPVQLIVTGVAGTVVLSWDDPALFYRPASRTGGQSATPPPVSTLGVEVEKIIFHGNKLGIRQLGPWRIGKAIAHLPEAGRVQQGFPLTIAGKMNKKRGEILSRDQASRKGGFCLLTIPAVRVQNILSEKQGVRVWPETR